MKKTYMKPALYVENFELSQSIAAGCTAQKAGLGTPSYSGGSVCGWEFLGQTYFANGINPDCEAGEIEIVCYNAPNGNIMFAS